MARANARPMARRIDPKTAAKLERAVERSEIVHALAAIPQSPFLMGAKGNWSGVTFDWFVKPGNITKIGNGSFHDGPVFNSGDAEIDALKKRRWEIEKDPKRDGFSRYIDLQLIDTQLAKLGARVEHPINGAVIDAEFQERPAKRLGESAR